MTNELYCQNTDNGTLFDITTLAGNIQYTTDLSGQPGKLTFSLQEDPNGVLQIVVGSVIGFKVDNNIVFYGYVFTMGTDATGIYKITAYDQMRYLKNEETMYTGNMSASAIFTKISADTGLNSKVVTPTSWVVPEYYHEKKSLYNILNYAIMSTNINDGKYHFIKDDGGTLLFTELGEYKTNIVIGDKSLLSSYQYEISIDKDTYNGVKVIRDNEETGMRDVWIEFDSENQRRWGKLQKLVQAGEELNEAQIKELAANWLSLKNRETKTMKISALGVRELVAGSGFLLRIDKLDIKEYMWITSATHDYSKDYHVMSLDVFI